MSVIKCNKNKDLGQNRAAKQQQQRKRGGGVGHWGDIRSTYMYKHTEVIFETAYFRVYTVTDCRT